MTLTQLQDKCKIRVYSILKSHLKSFLFLLSLQLILSVKCLVILWIRLYKNKAHYTLYKVLLLLCYNIKCAWFSRPNLYIFRFTEQFSPYEEFNKMVLKKTKIAVSYKFLFIFLLSLGLWQMVLLDLQNASYPQRPA